MITPFFGVIPETLSLSILGSSLQTFKFFGGLPCRLIPGFALGLSLALHEFPFSLSFAFSFSFAPRSFSAFPRLPLRFPFSSLIMAILTAAGG